MKTKDLTVMALLTALAMVLSRVERFFPLELIVPLPGVKLGLANIVILFAVYRMRPSASWMIQIARCLLSVLFSGNLTGMAFSVAGGAMAILSMNLARRFGRMSVFGVSVLGSAGHHCGQILIAMILMHSVSVGMYLPYLLLIGTVCGLATGAILAGVLRSVRTS